MNKALDILIGFFNKKVYCYECKEKNKKKNCVSFADEWFCSEHCMSKAFKNMSTQELLEMSYIEKSKYNFNIKNKFVKSLIDNNSNPIEIIYKNSELIKCSLDNAWFWDTAEYIIGDCNITITRDKDYKVIMKVFRK